ncbi:MAG TPA: HlyD family efflux transporter periplasmic adaptor subunit, partial [Oscillatoriaceae cyanobacterium]
MSKPRRLRRFLWGGLGLLALVGVGLAARPKPLAVETARVRTGPMQVTLDEQGLTRLHDRYVISAPVAGQIARIGLEPGDRVEAGEPLVTFAPATPALLDARASAEGEAGVRVAEAALTAARAERARQASIAAHGAAEQRRMQTLYDDGGLSREALENTQAEARAGADALAVATANVRQAEEQLAAARAALSSATPSAPAMVLRAPIGGVIVSRRHESTAVVPAGEELLV